jgi:hypothetical protein
MLDFSDLKSGKARRVPWPFPQTKGKGLRPPTSTDCGSKTRREEGLAKGMQAGSVWGVHVLDTVTCWRVEKLCHVRLVRFAVRVLAVKA